MPFEYRSQLTAPKRKIPFSFTTSKKQWKSASTLNGRPYVVGSVPRTPNPREVEFEGLLNGGNVTKVISLGAGKAESRIDPSPTALAAGRAGMISSPLFSIASDIPASPVTSTASPARRSRFLPGGSMRKRSPAEYDALEFETRTMFDDELLSADDRDNKDTRRSKSSMGHLRKESKDDAWVDILVGSQRRLNDQAAELRPSSDGGRRRRSMSDPELAREEIAQALKDAGPKPPEDDDTSLSQYPTHEGTVSPTDEDIYGGPEDGESEVAARDSIDSADFEPIPHMRGGSVDDGSIPSTMPLTHSRSESGLLPPNLQLNVKPFAPAPETDASMSTSPPPPPPKTVPGKGVSSLIEMYRERERESLSQSRLPVRSTSLPPLPKVQPQPEPAEPELELDPQPEVLMTDGEDPFVGRVSPGAPRYVHGAPLHNVVEAPEEEDEEAI